MVQIDNDLKRDLSQLITNYRDTLPVYKLVDPSPTFQIDKANLLASRFLEDFCAESTVLLAKRSNDTTEVNLPENTKIRIYNNSNAMVIKKIMAPLDNIFSGKIDFEQLKERTIEIMKKLELGKWCSDLEQIEFERLWKIKASAITIADKVKVPEVLCRVIGAFRRQINKIPVYGRASVFVKLAGNNTVQSAGIDWRLIETEPVDEIKIIDSDEAAETILRNIGVYLPNKVITSKMCKPEFFSLGYFSLPRNRYQRFMQPAYIATFKSTGSTSLNPAAVISASKDIYESLSPIHAASTPMERTKIESK
jgi:hypothetical protein